jgi:murein DD-endopeptidase MepM/ murein hydrolase activator NlpD
MKFSFLFLCLCWLGAPHFGWAYTSAKGPALATAEPEQTAVKVHIERDGNRTRFLVENDERCEITMTFEITAVNLRAAGISFPHTATFPASQTTEAFVLEPEKPSEAWDYSYTNYFKVGSCVARHDDAVAYELPYLAGRSYKVTQGYNGSFSHTGANRYAIDWQMPVGTPVCATRGGVVVKLRQRSNTGGASMDYDKFNNYVLIRHDDGTLGHYCHLQQNSVAVALGDTVRAGQIIARSGNTGFSSGPHLHFSVFRTRNGKERESIPVRFRAASGEPVTLVSGKKYEAPSRVDATSVAAR